MHENVQGEPSPVDGNVQGEPSLVHEKGKVLGVERGRLADGIYILAGEARNV